MAILYDILKNNELSKYPPLPEWIQKLLETLETGSDYYFDFTHSIRFDVFTKEWTMSTEQ